jgi:NAD(P)H-dependent FMN reductase
MTILIINGSPLGADSVTGAVARRVVGETWPTAEITEVSLATAGLPACDGHLDSIIGGEQLTGPLAALGSLHAAMGHADAVVFVSPVHNFAVSALLKNFIDLLVFEAHRPSFVGKPVVLVATAMGAGQKRVVGRLGADASVLAEPWYEAHLRSRVAELARCIPAAIADSRPKVALRDLAAFRIWRFLAEFNRQRTPLDYQYWQARGWFDADYYYPCRSSPWARALAAFIVAAAAWTIRHRRMRPTR